MYFDKIERTITAALYRTITRRGCTDKSSVVILAYHEICELPRQIERLHPYSVTPSAFKGQMEFLSRNDYSVIKLEDFVSCLTEKREVPVRSVVITFDDGYKNNYTNAFPVLRRFNLPATIFLATDYIGTSEIFPWFNGLSERDQKARENWIPLSWEEITEMNGDGVAFGSHTCSHANIRNMSKITFEEEIERSRGVIERQIDKTVNLFSYPFSFPKYRRSYSDLTKEIKEALLGRGYLGACTTIIGTNSRGSDPFCLKRIQIKNTDDLFSFAAKVDGAYNWVGFAQRFYQGIIEPLIERRQ